MFSLVRFSGCPNCGSGSASLYRSKRHGVGEFLLHHLLHITPYRCKECDVRHFRRSRVHHHHQRPDSHAPKHAH